MSSLGVDFYFGDKMVCPPKRLDDKTIPGFRRILHNQIIRWPLYWQWGVASLLFKPYSAYITMGNIWSISTWVLLLIGRSFTGKKFFLWSHGWYGDESLAKRFVKKVFYSLAHDVFVYGEYARSLMLKNGFKADRVHVIYNSLDYSCQLEQRTSLSQTAIFSKHFKNNHPNLIFIGRLNPVKKLNLIIEALGILKEQGFPLNLTLIGDGEMKNSLEAAAADKKLTPNIWFFGPSYCEKDIAELIYNADLCVSPGNVGLTAMHSMMYGTPVLTHNYFPKQVPEFEAIIDGQTGSFFEFGNAISLAAKIRSWLEYSSVHREKIRSDCFRVIDEKYNPGYQVTLLKKVLSKHI